MFKIFIFLFIFIYFTIAEIVENNVFNCPNNGEPKKDETSGELIQCLPGWSSEATCGPNYLCFFSGFNYQCCPSNNENDQLNNQKLKSKEEKNNNNNDEDECPDDALAVLDSAGDIMHCDSSGRCPQTQMFCFSETGDVSESSVCCENFFYKENEQKEQKEQKDLINKNIEGETLHSNILDISTETTFLEENNLLISTKTINEKQKTTKTLVTTTTKPTTTKPTTTKTSIKNATIPTLLSSTTLIKLELEKFPKLIGTKERENGHKYDIYTKEEQEKNILINGDNNEDENDSAKNFLLEQIKQGWPYNEKFYREQEPSDAEDIVVLRRKGRPEAIVHFPN